MANKISTFKRLLIIPLVLFATLSAFAYDPSDETKPVAEQGVKKEAFNAGKLIIEHISDSHEWHVAGNFAIPLPIIIYSSEKGLSVFLSNKLEGGQAYKGYKLEENKIVAIDDDGAVDQAATAKSWDLSITKNVFALLFSIFLMLVIFISIAKSYKRRLGQAPKGLQSAIEPIILFIRDDIAKQAIGPKYQRYMPYLLTVFFFIWINNLMGLIPFFPGGANLTGNIAVPLTLAAMTFVITILSGNAHYWKHIFAMPGVPKWVLIILTPIEILGIFIKPFVLMVRLFANITAGHIVLLVFFCLIFIFGESSATVGYITSVPSILFTIFINCLELLVGLLQAYVFTFLSAIYFGMAVIEHHSEAH